MSGWERAQGVVQRLLDSDMAARLFAADSATLRHLQNGTDVYRLIEEASGDTLRAFRDRIGDATFETVRRMSRRYAVSPEQAAEYHDMLMTRDPLRSIIDQHAVLIERKRGTPLSTLLESDHVVEQRILRMLRDGPVAHAVRSPGQALADSHAHRRLELAAGAVNCANRVQMDDAMAVLVPANHIAGYRFARAFRSQFGDAAVAPWYYVHQGVASKTSWMRELVPWRLEGAYSYQQLLDATSYVMTRRLNMPLEFRDAIREDMIDEIVQMVAEGNDEEGAQMVLDGLGLGSGAAESRIEAALRRELRIDTPLDPARFESEWNHLAPLAGPAEEMSWATHELEAIPAAPPAPPVPVPVPEPEGG